ncbi:MAG: 5-(carboxyamino)imidazole ribonucleotide synthase [Geminicoccaceae bacterium]|nr:MAG: 5-(carboxyamino)imidazole ribonucleotide synthase [Geminicoccaceae bacterium]
MSTLAPGAVLGILGGGQLGRMLALAAFRLGLRVHVFAQAANEPAVQVTDRATLAPFDDQRALDAFAASVDVVTLEFENVPVASVRHLAERVPVRPGADLLAIAQDRLAEKRFARSIGLETAPFAAYDGGADGSNLAELSFPCRVKTRRLGYDGKGQIRVSNRAEVAAAFAALGGVPCIVESEVAFRRELSVLVARRPSGAVAVFPLAENRHADGILRESFAPAAASPDLVAQAETLALAVARGVELAGLLAIELFETLDGRLLINEFAPRPHNSGHWTLDGCSVDQFEQAVRAVCDWPLTPARALAPCRMINLLGDDVDAWPAWLAKPSARLHLYGKEEARSGRKMGHVTLVGDDA